MEDTLFDTQKKRDSSLSALKIGVETEFWRLLSDILKANIEVTTEKIIAGGGKESEMNRLRDKLAAYQEVLDTPDDLIRKLEHVEEDNVDIESDPYEKPEEPKENT